MPRLVTCGLSGRRVFAAARDRPVAAAAGLQLCQRALAATACSPRVRPTPRCAQPHVASVRPPAWAAGRGASAGDQARAHAAGRLRRARAGGAGGARAQRGGPESRDGLVHAQRVARAVAASAHVSSVCVCVFFCLLPLQTLRMRISCSGKRERPPASARESRPLLLGPPGARRGGTGAALMQRAGSTTRETCPARLRCPGPTTSCRR